MFRRQLEKSIVLKPVLALYWQGISQNKEPKDYKKLKHIVENHLEAQLLRRNQAALSAAPGPKLQMLPAMGDGKSQVQPRNGLCKKWAKAGECAAGDDCPWAASHTKENKPSRQGKGNGKGKTGHRSTSPSQTRDRAPTPQDVSLLLLKLGATQSASEENLLQAKLMDLLALGT